jgi:hypothetical protein
MCDVFQGHNELEGMAPIRRQLTQSLRHHIAYVASKCSGAWPMVQQ